MRSLSQVQRNIFRINAPAYAASLTRNSGVASHGLRNRITCALQRNNSSIYITGMDFAKSPKSGKWFVRVTTS